VIYAIKEIMIVRELVSSLSWYICIYVLLCDYGIFLE